MKDIVAEGAGIHILNQNFFETTISFIMSQNKQIPQIKQCIELFCRKYGNPISFEGETYYGFPSEAVKPTLEELSECKVGFRNKYIMDALEKFQSGIFNGIETWEPEKQKETLKSVKGIGEKVANCIMLFGLSCHSEFPVDVWIHRKMQKLFFDKPATKEEVQSKGYELFGKYAGYAQQYIFYAKEKS